MSKKVDRHKKLLQIISEQGMLPVKSLAAMLDTSAMTIYRDISELRDEHNLPDMPFAADGEEAASRAPSIYLSGPEVFYPDYGKILADKLRICEEHGFYGFPNESTGPTPPYDDADLFDNLVLLINKCDIIVANLCAFRGPEPDSGTVWECAYGVCNKKRVYGYYENPDMITAVENHYAPVAWRNVHGVNTPFDKDGNRIENWGKPLNLMLAHSIILVQGGFEDAINRVARDYSSSFRR